MKTLHTLLILGGALLISAGAASAGQLDEPIVANVPFDFVVGTTHLPAGKYVVKPADPENPAVVLIESTDRRHVAYALTIPLNSNERTDRSSLVFEKRENRYVLSKVMPLDGEGDELPVGHAVRQEPAAAPTNP